MIDTIVLDLDGPLLDGRDRHYQCYRDILLEQGLEPVPVAKYWRLKRGRVDRRRLLSLSGASDFYDGFLAAWLRRIESKKYLRMDRLQDRAMDVLQAWKGAGVTVVLATMRNNPDHLMWQLRHLGLAGFFDEVVAVGCGLGWEGKAERVRPVLARSRRGGSVYWVGDTETDVCAARALGVRICALTCGLRTESYLAGFNPDLLKRDLWSFFAEWLRSERPAGKSRVNGGRVPPTGPLPAEKGFL